MKYYSLAICNETIRTLLEVVVRTAPIIIKVFQRRSHADCKKVLTGTGGGRSLMNGGRFCVHFFLEDTLVIDATERHVIDVG